MKRKERHTLIFVGLAVISILGAIFLFANAPTSTGFVIWFGSSLVLVLFYWLVCWLNVPRNLRSRPARPADFEVVGLGSITANTTKFLEQSKLIKKQTFGDVLHELYRVERVSGNGVWVCEVETASDRIVAWQVTYESVESPVIDLHERVGDGRFLVYL
jgi:hypothetical protein